MVDVFREVDEALREDTLKNQWRRYGPWIVGAVVLILGSVAGWVIWQNLEERRELAETQRLFALVAEAEQVPQAGLQALTAFAEESRGGAALLARFEAAGLAAELGDPADAAARYRQIAGDSGVAGPWRDLARLLAVLHDLDQGDPAALTEELAPLRGDGHALRHSARELAGLVLVRQGDPAAARALFAELAGSPSAPSGVRARAAELAAYLDR